MFVKRLIKDPYLLIIVGILGLILLISQWITEFKPLVFPVLGALIGYVTNVIAVWMIFNPKKPLPGIKYQGIVPKSKEQIAENLAQTIEKNLVNPSLINQFLMSKSQEIKNVLLNFVWQTINQPLPCLKILIAPYWDKFKSLILKVYKNVQPKFLEFIDVFLNSLCEKPLKDIVKREKFCEIKNKFNARFEKFIEKISEKQLKEFVEVSYIENFSMDILERLNKNFISVFYKKIFQKSIYELYPRSEEISLILIKNISKKLRDPQVRRRIAKKIIEAWKNTQSIWEKMFVEVADVVIDLEEKIYFSLEEISYKIEEDPTILEEIRKSILSFLKRPIRSFVNRDTFEEVWSKVFYFLKSEVEVNIQKISEKKIKELLPRKVFEEITNKLHNWIENWYEEKENELVLKDFYERHREDILEILESWLNSTKVEEFLILKLESLGEKEIGNVYERLSRLFELDKKVEELVDKGFQHILKVIGDIVERIEVKKIVKERIEKYSVEEMEEVVFGVMKKEFRMIELLGIPIGFLVGLIQIFI